MGGERRFEDGRERAERPEERRETPRDERQDEEREWDPGAAQRECNEIMQRENARRAQREIDEIVAEERDDVRRRAREAVEEGEEQ